MNPGAMSTTQISNSTKNGQPDNRAAALDSSENSVLAAYALNDPPLPDDPAAALQQVLELDREDAERDRDSLGLKIRRAGRLDALKDAKVHKALGLSWEQFVDTNFAGGYDAWSRYRSVARVQRKLYEWKLPLVATEALARALAPRLDDRGFEKKLREFLAANENVYPSSRELTRAFRSSRMKSDNKVDREKHLVALLESDGLLVDERAHLSAILERIRATEHRKRVKRANVAQGDLNFEG